MKDFVTLGICDEAGAGQRPEIGEKSGDPCRQQSKLF